MTRRVRHLAPTTQSAPKVACCAVPLVAEVALAGEDHGDAVLVGRLDHLAVAYRTPRLHHRRDAGGHGGVEPGAEGEEGVAAACPAGGPSRGPLGGDPCGVEPVLLAGADPD